MIKNIILSIIGLMPLLKGAHHVHFIWKKFHSFISNIKCIHLNKGSCMSKTCRVEKCIKSHFIMYIHCQPLVSWVNKTVKEIWTFSIITILRSFFSTNIASANPMYWAYNKNATVSKTDMVPDFKEPEV